MSIREHGFAIQWKARASWHLPLQIHYSNRRRTFLLNQKNICRSNFVLSRELHFPFSISALPKTLIPVPNSEHLSSRHPTLHSDVPGHRELNINLATLQGNDREITLSGRRAEVKHGRSCGLGKTEKYNLASRSSHFLHRARAFGISKLRSLKSAAPGLILNVCRY